MPDGVDLSIVIVSFNCRDLLLRCLECIPAAAAPLAFETIVVDNASVDGTPDAVRAGFPAVRLVASGDNLGFGAANNVGVGMATGRWLVLLNPDTEARPASLSTLARLLEGDRSIGLVGPRLVYPDGSLQPSCRAFPSLATGLIVLLKLYRAVRWLPAIRRYDCHGLDYDRPADVDQVMGACMVISRALFTRLEGFDERFWMWFEEVDLCYRVKADGLRVHYTPSAVVMHRLGQSAVLLHSVFAQRMYARSLVAFFRKHHGAAAAALLRSVAWVGVVLAHGAQTIRRMRAGAGPRYRITAGGPGARNGG
jgi:GT2 family glycosyltransferase